MISGKTHIVEFKETLAELNQETNRHLSLFIDDDRIIKTKHIESIEVMQ